MPQSCLGEGGTHTCNTDKKIFQVQESPGLCWQMNTLIEGHSYNIGLGWERGQVTQLSLYHLTYLDPIHKLSVV